MNHSIIAERLLLLIIVILLIINPVLSLAQTSSDSTIAESQLEDPLLYDAEDSIILNLPLQKAYLYQNAHVDYGEISLEACYIEFDFETKEVLAKLCIDSAGNKTGIPLLSDGDNKTNADSLRFNFDSKRGITYQVKMQEGEGYIHGSKVKRQGNGDIHIDTALYTTCNLDHPHYYFKLRKAIIKPNDRIVSGPVNLFIADVPTPLGLPFGYFPNKQQGSNGLIIPTYGESALGFYLTGGGYYHKFKNDKVATQILGDIYSKGSWGVRNITQYVNRYKYSGSTNINYRQIRQGDPEFPDFQKSTEFFVTWRHVQDKKARPGSSFSANVNAGTVNNFRNDFYAPNANNYLSNNFNSNIAWSKQIGLFRDKLKTNLNVNLRHNQNSVQRLMTFTLPEMTYNINRFYPFTLFGQKKTVTGKFRKGLNKIGINYMANAKNETTIADSLISLDNIETIANSMKNGIRHGINASTSFKLLNKSITLNPAYQFSQLLYLDQTTKDWNSTDSSVNEYTTYGFTAPFWHTISVNATSKIYGFYQFARFLQGKKAFKMRHTITPSIGFSYRPESNFIKTYTIDTSANTTTVEYSPFQTNIYGAPSSGASQRMNFGLINSFEAKYKQVNDSTGEAEFKKIKILDNITFNSGYDFLRDSMNLDNISILGRTTLKKNIVFRFGGTLDPYSYNKGYRSKDLAINQTGDLGILTNSYLALSFPLRSKKGHTGTYNNKDASEAELEAINANPDAYVDFSIPWKVSFNYKINRAHSISSVQDTVFYTQTIGIDGHISLTEKWKFEFITNYDIVQKKFSYSSVNILRDLHCWEASFNWVPFGYMKSYNIQINVKSALLQDLKLQRRRNWYDNGVR